MRMIFRLKCRKILQWRWRDGEMERWRDGERNTKRERKTDTTLREQREGGREIEIVINNIRHQNSDRKRGITLRCKKTRE